MVSLSVVFDTPSPQAQSALLISLLSVSFVLAVFHDLR
ncbi:hypothetical protein CD31A_0232 [Corynebacterium diphtheriae 31A]|nr:hypothetical protein CD31A_0232 [Corynebacterium diphtheriae 31A]